MNPILMLLGLDNAGKTKLLYTLKLGKVSDPDFQAVEFDPTLAFNFEVLHHTYKQEKFQFKTWDLAGRLHLRPMWRYFYESTPPDALVFVVNDADNPSRMEEAKREFLQLLHDASLQHTIFVVVVNVRDALRSLKEAEDQVRTKLGLPTEKSRAKVISVRLENDNPREEGSVVNVVNHICFKLVERKRKNVLET